MFTLNSILIKMLTSPETEKTYFQKNKVTPDSQSIDVTPQPSNFSKKRLFEAWPGKNKFYLGGRLMHGSSFVGFVSVLIAKIFVSGLFFGLATPILWRYQIFYIPILMIVLLVLSIIFLFLAGCTDPGVIPRKELIEIIKKGNAFDCFLQSEKLTENNEGKYKFCHTCHIYRPPLCAHCL